MCDAYKGKGLLPLIPPQTGFFLGRLWHVGPYMGPVCKGRKFSALTAQAPVYLDFKEGFGLVIFAGLPDVLHHPPDTVVRAFALAAGVAVFDKKFLKVRIELADDVVVHHAVAETRCKNFPLYRLVYNKGHTAPGPVAAAADVVD